MYIIVNNNLIYFHWILGTAKKIPECYYSKGRAYRPFISGCVHHIGATSVQSRLLFLSDFKGRT